MKDDIGVPSRDFILDGIIIDLIERPLGVKCARCGGQLFSKNPIKLDPDSDKVYHTTNNIGQGRPCWKYHNDHLIHKDRTFQLDGIPITPGKAKDRGICDYCSGRIHSWDELHIDNADKKNPKIYHDGQFHCWRNSQKESQGQ